MTKIFNFPTCPVSKQLFHVPGAAVEGGYTAGAVRITSPEPGGRSVLEMQIALQVREWDFPISSWLMSKGNGEIFRIRMAPTPQVLSVRGTDILWNGDVPWSISSPWAGDITATYAAVALEGSTRIVLDLEGYGNIARIGHVVGHQYDAYIIDEIEYDDATDLATAIVKPPIRRNIAIGDAAPFRPYFTGTIANMSEVRTTYDADKVGHIQPGKIIFAEAIV